MKPVDLHNHVIPRTIIDAIRTEPALYAKARVAIEQEGDAITLVPGTRRFPMERELYDAEAKVEPHGLRARGRLLQDRAAPVRRKALDARDRRTRASET